MMTWLPTQNNYGGVNIAPVADMSESAGMRYPQQPYGGVHFGQTIWPHNGPYVAQQPLPAVAPTRTDEG